MNILDSNIIIYAPYPNFGYLRELISDRNYVSVITMIEVLGFQKLRPEHKMFFESAFKTLNIVDLNDAIVKNAIELKQSKKYSLGDSIIAATALYEGLTLQTNNEKDFKDILNLKVVNPMQ